MRGHAGGLFFVRLGTEHRDGFAFAFGGIDLLGDLVLVVRNDAVGRFHNHARGAIVALELEDAGRGILLLEVENVGNVCAAEAIDALRIVAHHADVRGGVREERENAVLREVGVLVLVDENVAEACLVAFAHFGVVAEEEKRVEEQVVEVEGLGGAEVPLVAFVDFVEALHALGVVAPLDGRVGCVGRGEDEAVLGFRDAAGHTARLVDLFVEAQFFHNVFQEGAGVGSVVDAEVGGDARVGCLHAEQTGKKAVERAAPHAVGREVGTDLPDAFVHLAGGLVGKGEGENAPRLSALLQQVGYLVGQYTGFARTCAGNDERGAVGVGHCGVLFEVECFSECGHGVG